MIGPYPTLPKTVKRGMIAALVLYVLCIVAIAVCFLAMANRIAKSPTPFIIGQKWMDDKGCTHGRLWIFETVDCSQVPKK